jgi:HK97 family phage major capsid protein
MSNDTVMIAFFLRPDLAEDLAAAAAPLGGVLTAPADLHLTLAILGDVESVTAEQRGWITDALSRWAASTPPVCGTLSGVGVFDQSAEGEPSPVYASFDGPTLPAVRESLVSLVGSLGVCPDMTHGFSPHITLSYVAAGTHVPSLDLPADAVCFDSLVLAWGEEHISFLMGTALQAPAYAVKFAPDSRDRIEGYLVRWGSPREPDTVGDWFEPDTDFGNLKKFPMLYHHGKNPHIGPSAVGIWDEVERDDVGLFVRGELFKHHLYRKRIEQLIERGALGLSSGANPRTMYPVFAPRGKVQRWHIVEGSLTPTPAEPRNTGVGFAKGYAVDPAQAAAAFKAVNLSIPADLLLLQDEAEGWEKETRLGDHAAARAAVKSSNSSMEGKHMADVMIDQQTIAQAVQAELDRRAAAAQAERDQEARINAEVERRVKEAQQAAATKSLPMPQGSGEARIDVVRATKYSHLTAPDMAFLYELMSGHQANIKAAPWTPSEGFLRELADKVVKAVNKGELGYDAIDSLAQKMGGAIKANELDSVGQSGFGAEWAPDSWRAELWLRTRQDNVIAPLFEMIEMPTNPYELPIESTDPTVYFVAETTDATQLTWGTGNPITLSKIGSGKVQMNAKKLALRVAWSAELNEDSLIPVIANYRRQALRAMQNAIDNVLVNGDTATGASTNINLIDGTPTTGTKYLAFNGLRKYCLVTNSAQSKSAGGPPTLPLLRTGRFLLNGAYALRPRDLAWIVDDLTYARLLNLPEFQTMDKAGNAATNLTGQVGVIDGVPVFATAEMGLSQTADGKISGTPANNAKGQAICVFRPSWMLGYRRQVTAVVEYLSSVDAYHLIVTARLHLVNFDTQSAAELYNLTV